MKSKQVIQVLESVLAIMQPLVTFLIRRGVTYIDFAQALKKVFLQQAINEAQRVGSKQTDSALSLLSGLQRRDVQQVRLLLIEQPLAAPTRSTVPTETIGKWLANPAYPDNLIFAHSDSQQMSFEQLVWSVSKDKHPRSVLNELIRIKVVEWDETTHTVKLLRKAFLPDASTEAAHQLFKRIITDHIAAAVHNLDATDEKFLEQAVFADELTPESVVILQQYSRKKWQAFMQEMLTLADVLCNVDKEKENANQRFTVGMFNYAGTQLPEHIEEPKE
jgi:hypothetical protein